MPQAQEKMSLELEKEINEIIKNGIEKAKKVLPDGYYIKYEFAVVDYQIRIDLYVVTKMLEISEYCNDSDRVEEIKEELGRELSDEEIDELYNECYESTLSEINEEYTFYQKLIVMSGQRDFEIWTGPVECRHDYCEVGGVISIVIDGVNLSTLNHIMLHLDSIIDLWVRL
ncbi:MAG: hypothetical protein QXT26_08625 [Thermoproteota archaeon]